jgi:hypothetical protein
MTAHPTGLLTIDSATYHADQLDDTRPSLSKSIIQTLIEKSPAHARVAHPRLNPDFERTEEARYDTGTIAHALFLEGDESKLAVAPEIFTDWKKKAAQEIRDEARACGQIPLLASQAVEVRAMVAALREQCDAFPVAPVLFTEGVAEGVLTWEEGDVLCKARVDWLRNDLKTCDDLKTAARSANPEQWTRSNLWSIGAHIQAAFYGRGLRAKFGVDPEFRFCVVETTPPYAMSVVSLAPSALELAEAQIDWALDVWKRCLDNDVWPSYPQRICYAEAPSWEMTRWMEREAREEFAA